jgi:hypothetical protein
VRTTTGASASRSPLVLSPKALQWPSPGSALFAEGDGTSGGGKGAPVGSAGRASAGRASAGCVSAGERSDRVFSCRGSAPAGAAGVGAKEEGLEEGGRGAAAGGGEPHAPSARAAQVQANTAGRVTRERRGCGIVDTVPRARRQARSAVRGTWTARRRRRASRGSGLPRTRAARARGCRRATSRRREWPRAPPCCGRG